MEALKQLALEAKVVAKSRKAFREWEAKLEEARPFVVEAEKGKIHPTIFLPEAVAYHRRATHLNWRNIGRKGYTGPCGDPLQDHIPIYDTVRRRYAGFSNVLEQLWYGHEAPKIQRNRKEGWDHPQFHGSEGDWLYLCLVHRVTGSGASFEWDHGWRNTIVPATATMGHIRKMAAFVRSHPAPVGTSIGNQYPAVQKQHDLRGARNHLQFYLAEHGPILVKKTLQWLRKERRQVSIQECVEEVLRINGSLGQKRFVFVLTAWVMDIAEYLPKYVDPWSDVFHGKNAQTCISTLFTGGKTQLFFDTATRIFSDLTETFPMDVEDVQCDSVRWIKNYVPKNGFDHVHEKKLYNTCSLHYRETL